MTRNKKKSILISIIVLLPISVFVFLGLLQLRLEEPRRGLVALEMFLSGDYVIPSIHGWPYYNKPPLFNWSIAACYHIFKNFSEWVVRLPTILAYLLTGICIYRFAKPFFNKETAILAALFFLTFSDQYFFGTEISGEIDLFFTFIVFLQLSSLCWFFFRGKYLHMFLVSYLFTALAFLTKGMPSLLFQGVTLLVVCTYYKRFSLLFGWKHLVGIIVFGMVTGSYFYAYQQRGGDVATYLARLYFEATDKSGLDSGFKDILINFVQTPIHLVRFLSPWIFFLFFLLYKKKPQPDKIISLFLWMVGVNILPYLLTADTKLKYMYPLSPFIAILLAYYYTQLKSIAVKTNKILEKAFFVLIILIGVAVIAAPFVKEIKVALPGAGWYSIFLAIAIFTVAYLYRRWTGQRIYLFVLFWILLKLSVNIFYYPAFQYGAPEQHYKEYVQKIVQKAGNHRIHLWGNIHADSVKMSVGFFHFDTVIYDAPTYISFKFPFYYSAMTRSVMPFSATMKKDSIYLCVTDKKLVSDKVQVLDVGKPDSTKRNVFYLIRPLEDIPFGPKKAGAYVRFE